MDVVNRPEESLKEHPILFFDGVCVLCNGFVNRVLGADRRGAIRLAPLQGETASRVVGNLTVDEEPSMLWLDETGIHARSAAFLKVCGYLGGGWKVFLILRWVPAGIRDAVYRLVARNRYRWFGRHPVCRVPTAPEKNRFLP